MRAGWILAGTSVGLAAIVGCSGNDVSMGPSDSGSDTPMAVSVPKDSGSDATVDSTGPDGGGPDSTTETSLPNDGGLETTVDDTGAHDSGPGTTDATIDSGDATGSANDAPSDSLGNADSSEAGTIPDSASDVSPDIEIPDVTFNDGPNEAGLCNNLTNSATPQTVTYVSGPLPVGTGGTVRPGLYWLTAATVFVSDGGVPDGGPTDGGFSMLQETMALDPAATPATFLAAIVATTSGAADQTENETFTLSGNSMAATLTCGPWSQNGSMTYTFDSSSTVNRLHAFITNLGGMGLDAELVFDLH